jgi:tetratricopeptide (TPR) repeat protein
MYHTDYDYGMAAMFKSIANEMRKKAGEEHFNNIAFDLSNYGDLLYHSRDYREALRITEEAVSYPGNPKLQLSDTLNAYLKMNAWNVIGLSMKLGVYDSALIALSADFTDREKRTVGEIQVMGRCFLQGRYDSRLC